MMRRTVFYGVFTTLTLTGLCALFAAYLSSPLDRESRTPVSDALTIRFLPRAQVIQGAGASPTVRSIAERSFRVAHEPASSRALIDIETPVAPPAIALEFASQHAVEPKEAMCLPTNQGDALFRCEGVERLLDVDDLLGLAALGNAFAVQLLVDFPASDARVYERRRFLALSSGAAQGIPSAMTELGELYGHGSDSFAIDRWKSLALLYAAWLSGREGRDVFEPPASVLGALTRDARRALLRWRPEPDSPTVLGGWWPRIARA
jgi:hypothetical protein